MGDIKTLYCYDDEAKWGQMLHMAALKRGWKTELFKKDNLPADGVAFYKMNHNPKNRNKDKENVKNLIKNGVKLIPQDRVAAFYDNKILQSVGLTKWMPKTYYAKTAYEACNLLSKMGFPFISKTSEGASSHNVRIIRNYAEALKEVGTIFDGGLHIHHEQKQANYVLWQEMLQPEAPEYRVVCIGKQRYVKKNVNREGVPLASGSGVTIACNNHKDEEVKEVLQFVNEFVEREGFKFVGIDIKKQKTWWRVLEITCAWGLPGMFDTQFFPDTRTGAYFFDIILDELEKGNL